MRTETEHGQTLPPSHLTAAAVFAATWKRPRRFTVNHHTSLIHMNAGWEEGLGPGQAAENVPAARHVSAAAVGATGAGRQMMAWRCIKWALHSFCIVN